MRWLDDASMDLRKMGLTEWKDRARNRETWRHFVEEAKAHPGLQRHREEDRGKLGRRKKSKCPYDIFFSFSELTPFKLTHCGRVTQICVFNTVKLVTSASSPQCHSTWRNVSRGITPSSTTRVFGEYFLKISVHKNSQRICYKFLKKHSIKVD